MERKHAHWLTHSPLSTYLQRSGTFSDPFSLWQALSHLFDCIIPLQNLPKPSTDLSLLKGKGKGVDLHADIFTRSIVESMLVLEASLCAEIIHVSIQSMIKAFVFTFELCRLFAQTSTTSMPAPEMISCLSSLFALARSVLADIRESMKKLIAAKGCLGDITAYDEEFSLQVPVMGIVLETIHLYESEAVTLGDILTTMSDVLREVEVSLSTWEEWWTWVEIETDSPEFLGDGQLSARDIIPEAGVKYDWKKDWEMAVKYSNCFEYIRRIASNRHKELVPIVESVPRMPREPLGPGIKPPEVDVQPIQPSLKRRRIIQWNRPTNTEPTGFDRHWQTDLPGIPIRIKRADQN